MEETNIVYDLAYQILALIILGSGIAFGYQRWLKPRDHPELNFCPYPFCLNSLVALAHHGFGWTNARSLLGGAGFECCIGAASK